MARHVLLLAPFGGGMVRREILRRRLHALAVGA
jgi:hypothetical protein